MVVLGVLQKVKKTIALVGIYVEQAMETVKQAGIATMIILVASTTVSISMRMHNPKVTAVFEGLTNVMVRLVWSTVVWIRRENNVMRVKVTVILTMSVLMAFFVVVKIAKSIILMQTLRPTAATIQGTKNVMVERKPCTVALKKNHVQRVRVIVTMTMNVLARRFAVKTTA